MGVNINASELAKHGTKESCWVAIHGEVWDVTDFLKDHPGGVRVILGRAGQDATASYATVHGSELVAATLPPSALVGTLDPASRTAVDEPAEGTGPETNATAKHPPLISMVNISDFERAAHAYISPVGWAYYAAGAEDELSLSESRRVFSHIALRPRILRSVEPIDTSCTFFGGRVRSSLPVYISPTGVSRYAHPDGERSIARACGHEGILYCMPTSAAHEAVLAARLRPDQPVALQLYTGRDYEKTRALLRKAEALGAAAIFLTVDSPVLGRRERDNRIKAAEGEDPLFGTGVAKMGSRTLLNPLLSWEDLRWVRETTRLPLVLKGVQTVEDAVLAYQHGVDGIVLSNHGGRSLDTAQTPMITLLEIRRHAPYLVSTEARAKFQIFLDGGVRRGTDVIKALALGASAVGIGRPALYALTNGWGEAGVRRLITMLRVELETNMALAGATRLDEVVEEMVNTGRVEGEVAMRVKL